MSESSESQGERIERLAAIFELIGADDPQGWARSEIVEDIPQLARYVFLREAWQRVINEDDEDWIDQEIALAQQDPDGPGGGIGSALQNCLNAGVNPTDLTEIVRWKQYTLLFDLCYLLDDPGRTEPELGELGWELHEIDTTGQPTHRILGGLHESVLSMDPTGREMRPKI